MVILVRLSGPHQDEQLSCDAPVIRLGRGRANEVSFDRDRERVVSNFHAEIRLEQGSYFLCDLQSTHGTFLNGQRISHEQLHEGDVIGLAESMGGPRLRFSRRTTGTAAVRMADLELPSWQDTAAAPVLAQSQTMPMPQQGPSWGPPSPGSPWQDPSALGSLPGGSGRGVPELPPPPAFLPELELDASDAHGIEPNEHTVAVRRRPGASERVLAPVGARGGLVGARPPVPSEPGMDAWQGAPTHQGPHPDFIASAFSPPLEATSVSHSRSTTEIQRQGLDGVDPFLGAQVEATNAAFSPAHAPPPSKQPQGMAWNPAQPGADTVADAWSRPAQHTDPFAGLGSIPGQAPLAGGYGAPGMAPGNAAGPSAWQASPSPAWAPPPPQGTVPPQQVRSVPERLPPPPPPVGSESMPPARGLHRLLMGIVQGMAVLQAFLQRHADAARTPPQQGKPSSLPAQTVPREEPYRPQTAKNLVKVTGLERNASGGLKPFVLEEALKEKKTSGQWSLPTFLLVLAVVFGLPFVMYKYGDEIMLRLEVPQSGEQENVITARGLTEGPIEPPGIANPELIAQAQALKQRLASRQPPEAVLASNTTQFMRLILHALGEDVAFVPKELGNDVQREVNRIKKRKDFLVMYRRSQRERPKLNAVLERYHLPVEYSFLPWVLSGFQAGFRSSEEDRAGMWALTPERARRHGLTVTRQKDERLDLEKSTLAATSYFLELLGEMQGQSFTLALGCYVEGPFGARRMLSRQATWQPGEITLWTFLNSSFLPGGVYELLVQVLAVGTIHAAPEYYGLPEEQE